MMGPCWQACPHGHVAVGTRTRSDIFNRRDALVLQIPRAVVVRGGAHEVADVYRGTSGEHGVREQDALHEALSVDCVQARESLGLLLRLHDLDVVGVDGDVVVRQKEVLGDHPPRGDELVLVAASLDGREPVQLLLAVLVRLRGLNEDVASLCPGQLHHHDVDHPLDLAIGPLAECGLALGELLGEIFQALEGALAPRGGVDLVLAQEFRQLFLLQTNRRVHKRGEVGGVGLRDLDVLGEALVFRHPREIPGLTGESAVGGRSNSVQHHAVGGGHLSGEDLLPVHGVHARVHGGLEGLLECLNGDGLPLDATVDHAQHVLRQPVGRL
mmetsp:Transcript_4259/g.12053  ORF Transcript_4259/g.12053 Transcript_4259/m.12053 type:complete len:327 (-) Transcript_4259:1015-1995(-)